MFFVFVFDHLLNFIKLEVWRRIEFFHVVHFLIVEEDHYILSTDVLELTAFLYKISLSSVFFSQVEKLGNGTGD